MIVKLQTKNNGLWLSSTSMGSTSTDPSICGSKISFFFRFPECSKKWNLNFPRAKYYNEWNKHNKSMWKPWVGTTGNLKIIKMTRACGFRFYAHTVPFYSRDLGIVDFGVSGRSETSFLRKLWGGCKRNQIGKTTGLCLILAHHAVLIRMPPRDTL